MPYKRILKSPYLNTTDYYYQDDTSYYFYTNNKVIKDSSRHYSSWGTEVTVNNYIYTNFGIIKTSGYYGYNPFYIRTDSFQLQYINGNITKQIDTSTYNGSSDFEYVYDDHPNPFYRTQSKISLDNRYPLYFMETLIDDVFEKNNAVEVNQYQGPNNVGQFRAKYVYQYRADGYPKVAWFYNLDDTSYNVKYLYFYTN